MRAEFEEWKVDREFMNCEARQLQPCDTKYVGDEIAELPAYPENIVVAKVFWLNPPGKRSTRVSIDIPMLSTSGRGMEQRNLVAGWRCEQCKKTLFGTSVKDLYHLPCCKGFVAEET